MGTTTLGLPYPDPSDLVTNGAAAIQSLAEAVDAELETPTSTPRAMRALSAPQSTASAVWTPILFDYQVVAATNGITYDAGTGEFTLPRAGVYLVTGQVRFLGSASARRLARLIFKGAALVESEVAPVASPSSAAIVLSSLVVAAPGDKVQVHAYQNIGSTSAQVYGSSSHIDTYLGIAQVA